MLDKSRRVPRELFKTIFEDKKNRLTRLHSSNFSLAVSTERGERARAAVAVSKKVSKSAVARNKVRRRAYSVFDAHMSELEGGIYMLMAKKGADKLNFEAFKTEAEGLISKFLLKE
jgi:ribonuclease P protein component